MSDRYRLTPAPLLLHMHKTADAKLGEEIQRMARADIAFAWALWELMEIDIELERRGRL